MKLIIIFSVILFKYFSCFSQSTCTIAGTVNLNDLDGTACSEGGTPGALAAGSKVIITGILQTDGANQSAGTGNYKLEISGGMNVLNNTANFNGSIRLINNADLNLDAKLHLPTGATVGVEDGATITTNGSTSDLLKIGTQNVILGNGSCQSDLTIDNDPPYCGSGGITGPIGFVQLGIDTEIVLPITLGFFHVIDEENSLSIEWQTITEENFDFFSIERSEDGENFYEIGTVPGHGNSNDPIDYSFVDENPLFGTSFYRLNAIDYDGTYEKFQIISVVFVPDEMQISVYPNPGNGKNTTLILGLPSEAKIKTLSVWNVSGEQVLEKSLGIGKNEIDFKQSLGKGFYFAKIKIDNFTTTRKLIIN